MNKPVIIAAITLFCISCATNTKNTTYLQRPVSSGSSVGIIIDAPNPFKNVILAKFMAKGYAVKAINASDIYTLSSAFDINDFKKLAYQEKLPVVGADEDQPITSAQKSFDSIFKLHVYNYELNKAETLRLIRDKWDVKYLIILDMANWESYSWGRAIDLTSLDLIWVDNFATRYNDSVETLTDHFIASMSSR